MCEGLSIGQFFCELNPAYMIGYFDNGLRCWRFSGETLAETARREIAEMRRNRYFYVSDARELTTKPMTSDT